MERSSGAAGPSSRHLSGEQTCSGLAPCVKRMRATEAPSSEGLGDGLAAQRPGCSLIGTNANQGARCDRLARSKLSFGDELEDGLDDGPGIAASTAKRFSVERKLAATASHTKTQVSPFSTSAAEDGHAAPSPALGRLCFGVAQARGARAYMEDKYTAVSSYKPVGAAGAVEDGVERSYFAVFDGHNGKRSAEEASSRLHAVLARDTAFHQCRGEPGASHSAAEAESTAMRSAMTRAFSVVDGEILDRARAEDSRDGSTGLVVVRAGSVLWAAHAGDSRAVLARGAKAVRLTEDHKPCLPTERLRVEANGGRVQLGRGQRCWRVICEPKDGRPGSGLAVSRSFGDLDFKQPNRFVECKPDVLRLCLQPDDHLVILASDGLWDVINDQTAVDLALATLRGPACASRGAGHMTDARAKMVADALVMDALERKTLDNITVIVLLLQWD